jgi:hypothetical protein
MTSLLPAPWAMAEGLGKGTFASISYVIYEKP